MFSSRKLLTRLGALWFVLGIVSSVHAATLRILSPLDGDVVIPGQVMILLQVELGRGETLKQVSARVDGAGVALRSIAIESSAPGSPIQQLRLPLAAGSHRIELTAETSVGIAHSARLTLQAGPAADPRVQNDPLLRPQLYVLSIGISEYQDSALRLRFPAKDAEDLARALRLQTGGLYRDVQVRLLTNEKASKSAVLDGLDWLQHHTTNRDVAAIFLAGHGIRDSATGTYYFLPADANINAVKRTMISQEDLQASLRSLPGKVLVFLDTCFAGQVMRWQERTLSPDLSRFVQELVSADSGVVVFASSSGRQTSQESASWSNGAFTRALVEGLSGRAALPGRGSITLSMLDLYLSDRVKQLTAGMQTPTMARPEAVADFPIAIVRAQTSLPPVTPELPEPSPPAPPLAELPTKLPPSPILPTLRSDARHLDYLRNQLYVEAHGVGYVVLRGAARVPIDKTDFFHRIGRDDLREKLTSRTVTRKALLGAGMASGLLGVGLVFAAGVSYAVTSREGFFDQNPFDKSYGTAIGLGVTAGILILLCPVFEVSGTRIQPDPINTGEARAFAEEYNQRLLGLDPSP